MKKYSTGGSRALTELWILPDPGKSLQIPAGNGMDGLGLTLQGINEALIR